MYYCVTCKLWKHKGSAPAQDRKLFSPECVPHTLKEDDHG